MSTLDEMAGDAREVAYSLRSIVVDVATQRLIADGQLPIDDLPTIASEGLDVVVGWLAAHHPFIAGQLAADLLGIAKR